MLIRVGADQLGGDPNGGAGQKHRTFDDHVRSQVARDVSKRASAILEMHHRGPRHDPQGAILRKLGDEHVRHAVHEVIGLALGDRVILQRQNGHARSGQGS